MPEIELYAPASYWIATDQHPQLVDMLTGGCGPGGKGDVLVPDTMYGLSVRPACKIHDWYYSSEMPATYDTKEEADRVFLENMQRIIKAQTASPVLRWLRMRRAMKYYLAVKWFGAPAFWAQKTFTGGELRKVEA